MSEMEDMIREILRKQEGMERELARVLEENKRMRESIKALASMQRCNAEWLTIDDVATILGYERRLVWRMVKGGELRGYQPTRKKAMIRRRDLEDWITGKEQDNDSGGI